MKNISTRLSVQFSLTGLSFCVKSNEEVIDLYAEPTDFESPEEVLSRFMQRFEEKGLQLKNFDSVLLIHQNEWSSFVPKAFFDEGHLSDYLQYNIALIPTDYIAYDVIANNDMINVYLPFVNINNYFLDQFGTFQYKHHLTVLIESIFNAERNKKTNSTYLHFNEKTFDLISFKNGKLQFCNQFQFETAEDVLYYLIFCTEQIGFSNDFSLFFLGKIESHQSIVDFIKKYIDNVENNERLAYQKLPPEHFILLNQHA